MSKGTGLHVDLHESISTGGVDLNENDEREESLTTVN